MNETLSFSFVLFCVAGLFFLGSAGVSGTIDEYKDDELTCLETINKLESNNGIWYLFGGLFGFLSILLFFVYMQDIEDQLKRLKR